MECEMGSAFKAKGTISVKAKKVDTVGIKALSQMLNLSQRLSLTRKYGKILHLLEVDVQVEALTALTQFYDPPLRCFTFQDFQIAPTLEEFERILGLPIGDTRPYQYHGQTPSVGAVACLLKVHSSEVQEAQVNIHGRRAFHREFFETRLQQLAQVGDWDTFRDILALLIYGLVLFPCIDGYISYEALDVFMACYQRMENPVPALLADVYCSMTYCYERKGKRLMCCLPVLYIWLTTHAFQLSCMTNCPITDFQRHQLSTKNSKEWAEYLVNLQGGALRWCIMRWQDIEAVIYSCGTFPNVILMGTHGCINYNPSLALRQLGYPMMGPPTAESTKEFIRYYLDHTFSDIALSIHGAWNKVVRKGRELGVRSCGAKDSYIQWVQERVAIIGLPFNTLLTGRQNPTAPHENEDSQESKEKLMEIKRGKRIAEEELIGTRRAFDDLRKAHSKIKDALQLNNEKLKDKEECLDRIKQCLAAADKELGLRRKERDEARTKVQELRTLLSVAVQAKRDAFEKVIDLEGRLAYSKGALAEEKQKKDRIALYAAEQEEVAEKWGIRFAQLANLTNNAIADIPSCLRAAEAVMNPLNTPTEMKDFIEYCKDLLTKMNDYVTKHH